MSSAPLVSPTELAAESQPKRPRLPEWQRVPSSDAEIEFQRNLSEELVFAWQDAASSDTRAGLERALFNVGVERLNAPGDIVEFDGTTQHTEDEVAQGDPVEVILPGWQLVNPRGISLLARAKVIKATPSPTATGTAGDANAARHTDQSPKIQPTTQTDGKPANHRDAGESSEPFSSKNE